MAAAVEIQTEQDGSSSVRVRGTVDRYSVPALEESLQSTPLPSFGQTTLDLSGVERLDSTGVAFLSVLVTDIRGMGRPFDVVLPDTQVGEALELLRLPEPLSSDGPPPLSVFEATANGTLRLWNSALQFFVLAIDTFTFALRGDKRTRRVRKEAVWMESERIGLGSFPIVALISLLVGLVVALQSAYQLRQFGANIYVANLIAVSMTREMGPLMTAIILAGRSGAAIAAEIATMMVTEEVAALRTMGLNPTRYIVVPKFKAITLTMPALTIFSSALGIFGGFIIAILYLDLGGSVFWNQVIRSLIVKDLVTGLVKSVAFAWIIVLVSAYYGFRAYGGAESVGRVTTQSVVASIFWVIVADAGFSLLFYFG